MTFRFNSESDAYAAASALRVAVEEYTKAADSIAANHDMPTLVRHFRDQAETARRIAVEIEQSC